MAWRSDVRTILQPRNPGTPRIRSPISPSARRKSSGSTGSENSRWLTTAYTRSPPRRVGSGGVEGMPLHDLRPLRSSARPAIVDPEAAHRTRETQVHEVAWDAGLETLT